jgi:hypothetical protein
MPSVVAMTATISWWSGSTGPCRVQAAPSYGSGSGQYGGDHAGRALQRAELAQEVARVPQLGAGVGRLQVPDLQTHPETLSPDAIGPIP